MSDLCRKREGNGFQICLIQVEKEKGSENDRNSVGKERKRKRSSDFPIHQKEKDV